MLGASTREPHKSRVVFSVCSRARYTRNPSLDIDLLSVCCIEAKLRLVYCNLRFSKVVRDHKRPLEANGAQLVNVSLKTLSCVKHNRAPNKT